MNTWPIRFKNFPYNKMIFQYWFTRHHDCSVRFSVQLETHDTYTGTSSWGTYPSFTRRGFLHVPSGRWVAAIYFPVKTCKQQQRQRCVFVNDYGVFFLFFRIVSLQCKYSVICLVHLKIDQRSCGILHSSQKWTNLYILETRNNLTVCVSNIWRYTPVPVLHCTVFCQLTSTL